MKRLHLARIVLSLAGIMSVANGISLVASGNSQEVVPAISRREVSDSYYESCRGLSGTKLLNALTSLTTSKHTTSVTYTGLRNYYLTTDVDPNNSRKVLLYYTGNSLSFSGTFGSSHGTVNREHVWCQSYLGSYTQTGPGSDLFNVHPIESTLNSTRNNRYFDNCSSGTYAKEYSSSTAYVTTGCRYTSVAFEPVDSYKGDAARSLFYVATRYASYGYTLGESPNASKMIMGKLSVLLAWNKANSPTTQEKARNEATEKIQGDRNPFIDHPEFATMIWDSSYSGSGALNDSTGSGSGSNSGSNSGSGSTTTSKSYTLDASALGLVSSSYASNDGSHTVSSIKFTTSKVLKNSSYGMQFQKTNGKLYNATAFSSNISKIVVKFGKTYSGTLKVYGASSAGGTTKTFTASTSGTTYTYTFSGSYKYFQIASPSATMYVSSITVYL